jgi:GT2 family glycosyltransferase
MKEIAAGIVLFNPDDLERLKRSIESVVSEFSDVYLFDNSTKSIDLGSLPEEVHYITEHSNTGVAYALNRIMDEAKKDGFNWVVTMDQDSVLPKGIYNAYKEHISDENVAIICPQVIDKRRIYMVPVKYPEKEYINFCITSGSCTSINIWNKVGRFDEWLFIDLVDNEFCKRVVFSGYKILRLNNYVMNQEFGKIEPKAEWKQKFWLNVSKVMHNVNFAKFSYKKSVSPMRVYYTNRNIIYVNKKLKNYGPTAYENYHCKGYLGFWFCFNFPSVLRAQNKSAVIKSISKGIKDGENKDVTAWRAN